MSEMDRWPLWSLLESSDEEGPVSKQKRSFDEMSNSDSASRRASNPMAAMPKAKAAKQMMSWQETFKKFFDISALREKMRRPLRVHTGCSGTGAVSLFLQETLGKARVIVLTTRLLGGISGSQQLSLEK